MLLFISQMPVFLDTEYPKVQFCFRSVLYDDDGSTGIVYGSTGWPRCDGFAQDTSVGATDRKSVGWVEPASVYTQKLLWQICLKLS